MRLLYAFVILCGLATSLVFAANPPNVIILLADDMGNGDTSCYGAKDIKTPNIDSLAASGIRFTSYYAPAPICSPSRAGLITGRYPTAGGHVHQQEHRLGHGRARPADPRDHHRRAGRKPGATRPPFSANGTWGPSPNASPIRKASTCSWATMPVAWIAFPTCITPASPGITTSTATATRSSRTACT